MTDQFKFNILTSNIRFHSEADGEHSWPNRKDHLAEIIHQYKPLILATQEGRQPQLKELNDLIPMWTILDQNRDWIEERMYPSLFYQKNYLDLIDSGDIWLSTTPQTPGSKSFSSAFPRLCTWGKFVFKNDHQKILAVNCHLDHVESQTRIQQLSVLLGELKNISHIKDFKIILMGDFNDSPDSELRDLVNQSSFSFKDPWLDFDHPEESSHHKFNGHNPEGNRIDWILLTKDINCYRIEMIKDHKNKIYPSDHFPIMATIELAKGFELD